MRKFLSLALAFVFSVALFVFPVIGTAADVDFTADFNDNTLCGFTGGGTVAVDSKTNSPCLEIAENQTATVAFSNNAQTVDFKLKAADAAKSVVIGLNGEDALTVSGDQISYTTSSDSTQKTDFAAGQWYNVRLTIESGAVKFYLDGRNRDYIANASEAGAQDFKPLSLSASSFASLSVTGAASLDDMKAYVSAQEGVSGMEASLLDVGFDNAYMSGYTLNTSNNNKLIASSNITFEKMKPKVNNTINKEPVLRGYSGDGLHILPDATEVSERNRTSGLFGKEQSDRSVYLYHEAGAVDTETNYESTMNFVIGKNAYVNKEGDTQVISFNFAFPEDASNRALTVRGRGLRSGSYGNASYESQYAVGSISIGKAMSGTHEEIPEAQLIHIQGDRVYFFGNTTFYAIVPGLTPNQWNNVRLEITRGDGADTDTGKALTYKAYINDIEIVSDGSVAAKDYYVQKVVRHVFAGLYGLVFNYNWEADKATAGGFYLDDIKVTNYYGGGAANPAAVPKRVVSPLYRDEKYQRPEDTTSEFPSTRELWDHDKWVTGNVVYVDKDMTLEDYASSLDSARRIGDIVFRNSAGETITNRSQTIGDITYMEITDLNYERRTIGLIGKTKELSSFEVKDIGDMSTTIMLADVGKWINYGSRGTFESVPAGGGVDGTVVSMGQNIGTNGSNQPSLRYSLSQRYNNVYRYDNTDRFRPVTFEFSALMPEKEDGYLQMSGRYADGPNGAQGLQFTTDKERSFLYLEDGVITAKGRNNATGDNKILLGHYNPGEWNHFAITYYPGIQTNRIDVLVNGGYSTENGTKHAFMLANRAGRLQTIEEFIIYYRNKVDNSQNIESRVQLKDLKVTAGYYQPQEAPSLSYTGNDLQIDGKTVTLKKAMTAQQLKEALSATGTINGIFADAAYGQKLSESDEVNGGNKIVVQQGALLGYYTVEKQAADIYQLDGDNEVQISGAAVAPGKKVIAKAPANMAGQLFIAVYDENGERLLYVNTANSTAENRASVDTGDFKLAANHVIKIFYFSPDGELQPLTAHRQLTVQ